MTRRRLGSGPPSEPRRSVTSEAPSSVVKPSAPQMAVGVVVLLAIVLTPLYLWRRPPPIDAATEPEPESEQPTATEPAPTLAPAEPVDAAAPRSPSGVEHEPARLIGCFDARGRRSSEGCAIPTSLDKALAEAIEKEKTCIGGKERPAEIEYVLDIAPSRRTNPMQLTVPRKGRTASTAAAVKCARQVKAAIPVDPKKVEVSHPRVRFSVKARYL